MKTAFLVLLCLFAGMSVLSAQTVTTLYTFNGLAAGDGLGQWVAGAGDVNMDGYPDIIVGAPNADPGGLSNAGQATVFSGKDGSILHTFNGLVAGDSFGLPANGAGDVNNDGFPDLIVGAHKADPGGLSNAGQATVFSGKDGSVLYTLNGQAASDYFSRQATGVGDVNKDGHADFGVAAFRADPGGLSNAGQVKIFSGKDGSTLFTFNGLNAGDEFGCSIAGAGDVDGDGFPDIIVGALHADPGGITSAGQARVFSGKDGSTLYTFNGLAQSDYFGFPVNGAGDVNRDGFPDLLVGAYAADPGGLRSAGQVRVFSGKDGSVLHTLNGYAAGNYLGYSLAGASDVNRDGYADFIVGAHGTAVAGPSNVGQATVFSGQDGSVLHVFSGSAAADEFGISVDGPGDLDRDGFPELLVGAWKTDPGSLSGAGQAFVFSAATTVISGSGSPGIGKTITLDLLAPGGNLVYQVGSSLGTGPIPIDTRLLHLSPDPLLFLSTGGLAPTVFSGYAGTLGANGKGTAALHIPGVSALIGIRIHSAFVTIKSGAPSSIGSISNTFSFTITK